MVGVALDVDHLRRDILGVIANRINNDATAYRTVRAGGSRFCCARNLELANLRIGWRQIKAKERDSSPSERAGFQKISTTGVDGPAFLPATFCRVLEHVVRQPKRMGRSTMKPTRAQSQSAD